MKNKFVDFSNIKGDLFGGITAGIVALPLALAFGVQSGMGAIAGLYGAMILGIFAAIFGGTATQISGPTGPMTVISALVIGTAIEMTGSLEAGMGLIIGAFVAAGAFQILFGILKVGKYIKYVPYPVLSGFMTGIGVIIILFQIYPFMGHASAKNTIGIFLNIGQPLSALNWSAIGLGALTIAIIYLLPKITKAVPSALVALVVATVVSIIMKLDVPIIGEIPSGIPGLKLSALASIDSSMIWTVLEFGAMLAALGAIDSLLTSIIADNITKTKHSSNRELIGQGIGNMAAGIIGGLPGAGATMRTVVNVNAGGRTRISGVVHGLLLVAILFGLGKYASYIPLSVLAGILITVGIGIIDYKGLSHLKKVPRADAAILVIVLLITVFGNLLHAVAVGLVMACVLFMKQSSDLAEGETSVQSLEDSDSDAHWDDEEAIYKEFKDKIYIKHLFGPMFFGFASKFAELISELDGRVKVLIIRMDRVPYVDQSGGYALEDAIVSLQNQDMLVLLTCAEGEPLDMLRKLDIVPGLVPESHIFEDFKSCELWLRDNLAGDGFDKMSGDAKKASRA